MPTAGTFESGKEFENSIKLSPIAIGFKDENLPNKDHDVFVELKESWIIDIEYDSDDEDEMEIQVMPRITVSSIRLQVFSKKLPERSAIKILKIKI